MLEKCLDRPWTWAGDARFFQPLLQQGLDAVQHLFPLGLFHGHLFHQFPVILGLEGAHAKVFQFALDLGDSQPVGQGGVNLQGFLGHLFPAVGGQEFQGAHVVGAVGQLDENDTHVLGHGHHHLASGLGLAHGGILKLTGGYLGDAVHQVGDLLPELGLQRPR